MYTQEEQKMIIAENLKRLLDERGLQQNEVAEAIGVSPQTFNTWTQAVAIPRMPKVQALADFFGVNKSQIIDREAQVEEGQYIPKTIAAHLDGAELSDDDVKDIADFIDYVIQRKAKKEE